MKTLLLNILLLLITSHAAADNTGPGFRRIDTGDGLANSQVNCIFKDRAGFMWFGTGMGLSRYDGFRFRNFFQNSSDSTTLRSNIVNSIMQPADGLMWLNTDEGYCIFDPATERFDRRPELWMKRHGMSGTPETVFTDNGGNLVIIAYGIGCWYYDMRSGRAVLMPFGRGRGRIPEGTVSGITQRGASLVLTYSDGLLARIDPRRKQLVWLNDASRRMHGDSQAQGFYTFIDKNYNYYVYNNGHTLVYSCREKRWFGGLPAFLRHEGVNCPDRQFIIKYMQQDADGNIWIATEHRGLLSVNLAGRTMRRYTYDATNPASLPDNTPQCVLADADGGIWTGTLRNGAAYWSKQQTRFATIPVGDICTMTEDRQGRIWMGSNDSGITCYDPQTGLTRRFTRGETGLGTDVVVSSLCQRDGTLWFGSYNGGMTRYSGGRFTPVKAARGALASNSVWTLAEDAQGHVVIGTLGSGVQLLDTRTMKFTTFNTRNSRLSSDYISSIAVCPDGRLLIGHSQNFSIINLAKRQITNLPQTHAGELFASRAVNQILMDRRGLIWSANMSGLNVYDPKTDRLYTLTDNSQMACSVTEDRRGNIWVALSHGVTRFSAIAEKDGWHFPGTSFDDMDGLQSRRLNYRSILTTHDGKILVGGQDGVNIIDPDLASAPVARARVVFSGLVLFDRPLTVGREYDGRVVLNRSINTGRSLRLKYSENAFTLLLASDHISVPQKARFMYRLEGFNDDHWLITPEGQPAVTYTNLSPGRYTLQVRVVNRDGSVSPDTAQMSITIEPPFWLTGWAFTLYALLAAGVAWMLWHLTISRKIEHLRIEQIRQEAERNRRLDEMKLTFFASVSHELRTPLTLIISPIRALIKNETDEDRRSKFSMILRNANRLLDLVNQTLDLRRIDRNKARLNLANGDIVQFTRELCQTFGSLSGRAVEIRFRSTESSLNMSFDDDKMEKILSNLISNALKFTPDGGHITVSVEKDFNTPTLPQNLKTVNPQNKKTPETYNLKITVADTGCGISDDDKQHIFDRFYQAEDTGARMTHGSGIGLNLVKEFSVMHGGDVSVADNPGGGTVFTVTLPYRFNPELPAIRTEQIREQTEATAEQGVPYAGTPLTETAKPTGSDDVGRLLRKGSYEVLLVDDNDDFLEFMKSQLQDTYRVRTARNGSEALKRVEEHRPDIILSDVMMPEMDGNELCRRLKSDPKTERIPFVMLTARLSAEYKIEGMTNGADDYITKPFNFDLLNLRIANLIKWRNATPVGEKIDPQITATEITSVDEHFVQKATEFVEQRLTGAELSVESMSEAMAMSRVHLYKRMLSVTGCTPSEFIRTIRLRHAARLLREGQLNVSEVAYKVGFNNPRYFSKYFKEMFGVMPKEYRKN